MYRIILFLLSQYLIVLIPSVHNTDTAKIKQSEECTSKELENSIQCFKEIPKPQYEVTQGSTVTMRCIVNNQHGKVQWRAVPVLLGYDRNIPGRPRYRYVGFVGRGEHHLEIRDVRKEDAGIFECQVQPVGDKHPLLRRKTELIVLVKPSEPQIFVHGVKPHNDQIIINSLNPPARSGFLCVSLNGQPAIKFEWFINNMILRPLQNTALVEMISSTRSSMSILTTKLKDGDVVRCSVSNAYTTKHHDPAKQKLNKDITITIHTPPGPPIIMEITMPVDKSNAYSLRDVIKSTCTSMPQGKPTGTIVWRWKFPKSRELYNNQRENFTIKDISPQFYQQVLTRNQLISKLELPPLTSEFHGAQIICVAINPVTSYESSPTNVLIKYPPAEVNLSTSDGSLVIRNIGNGGLTEAVIFGESGEQKSITCTTAKYYSDASIKWKIHYNPSVENLFQKDISFIPSEKFWQDGKSFRRNSTIKVTIDKQFDKSYLDCQAWSEGKSVEARVKLDITYPPEKPIITGHHSDSPVKLDHVIELTCSTLGGNPYPELQWYKDNKPIKSTFSPQQIGNQKSIKLRISPTKSNNNAKYFCQAKSVSLKNAPLNSDEFRLVVLFPPTDINLSSLSGLEIDDGNIVTLQCIAGESNPPAIVRWKLNRCGQMMMELGRRSLQKNCNEETLSSSSQKLLAGSFGGKRLKSNIEIRTTWKDHMDYVDCEVYNPDYGEDRQVLRKRLQLNITFPPKFEGIFNRNIIIEENQSKTFNIEPIANPPVTRYQWFKGTAELDTVGKSVTGRKSQFSINKASFTDSGNYTLVVTNDKGEARISIYLNVTYRPIILGDKFEVIVNNGQNIDLECPVRANPANPYQSYRWIKLIPQNGYNDISNSDWKDGISIGCNQGEWKGKPEKSSFKYYSKCNVKSQFEMNSLLIIYDVDRNDVGIYKCVVNNGIGGEVIKTVELIKYFTPQILEIPKFFKAAGSQGETVHLHCYIRSEPKPKISWFFGKYNFSISASSKYKLDTSRIRPGLYLTQLKIVNIQRIDHGKYFCKAENEKGSDTRMVELSGTSVPDIPMDIQLVNKTTNSITISWVQGFDGGSPQTFQVRWREGNRNGLFRSEDVAADDTKTTLDFILNGLKSDSLYYISINSRNAKHGKSAFSKDLLISTPSSQVEVEQTQNSYRPMTEDSKLQDNTILFIVAASVFGFVILVVNVLVIIFVLRRRRQRSRTAKLEARYNNPKSLLAASNGLILSRDDHMRDSNSNFLRGDAVELYPRGLDTSQLSHHLHSLRRSIPDDQKTFSSFETGSDDAREDLLRRQKEFGCCAVDPNSQKGSVILAYDPVNNISYYTPAQASSTTPIYLQPGIYDQDTLSTLLSPIHESGQKQLMSFMNIIPLNTQKNSSSCGSINSGGVNSTGPQLPGQTIGNNISPCGSVIVSDHRSSNNYNIDNGNNSGSLNTSNYHQNLSPNNSNAPCRPRMVSPTFLGYGLTPQQRDSYATELRKAQMSGNLVMNPTMFSRPSMTSPQVMINQGSRLSSQINHTNGPFTPVSFENISYPSNTIASCTTSVLSNDNQLNSSTIDDKFCQKYRCTDNQNHTTQPTQIVDNSIQFVNPAMLDSTIQDNDQDSHYLPRPNLI